MMKGLGKVALVVVFIFALGGTAMTASLAEANKQVLGGFTESVFVKKDVSAVDRYVRADYIQHNFLVKQGASGFKEFFSTWFASVPDWQYTLKKMVAEGDGALLNRCEKEDQAATPILSPSLGNPLTDFTPKCTSLH